MSKAILVSLMTVLTLILVTSVLAADTLSVSVNKVEFDGVDISSGTISVQAGAVIPVDIYFSANENANDVQVSTWIQGERSQAAEKDFADLIDGRSYHARLALKVPSDVDPEEDLTLYVRIESDSGDREDSYTVTIERESYKADFLLVEVDNVVQAGSSIPVDIVVKNLGRHELEDLIVSVSMPELGVSKKAYFGDLTPLDNKDEEGSEDEDAVDTLDKKMYIEIPADSKAGVYELIVEAFNSDVREAVKTNIAVAGTEVASNVLVPVTSKELKVGETGTYSLIIVNSGSKLGVYEIIPETVDGVMVTVKEPIVTVAAGSSNTVDVDVKALKEGTFSFGLNVNSDNQLVKRVTLTSVVGEKALTSNITILTIVLAIVFVVLLIVLIVLLTRKPMKSEELEESYY